MESIGKQEIRMNLKLFITIFIFVFSSKVFSLDTTNTHPLVTLEIVKKIKLEDIKAGGENAYQDIYELLPDPIDGVSEELQFLYWGTDFDPLDLAEPGINKQDYLTKDDNMFRYSRYNNVIDGVVQEDIPVNKVLKHFQHANTGIELTLPVLPLFGTEPSSQRAMKFFNESIDWMGGYTEEAKHTAFYVFGQALHHIEDMSSPAHIHNDAHLTLLEALLGDKEKDDYENWYLPQQKIMAGANPADLGQNNLEYWFSLVADIREMNNPWSDVWGGQGTNSMVQHFYNRTVYQADLEFPLDDVATPFLGGVHTKPVQPSAATGELAEMFPCKNTNGDYDTSVATNCLYWNEDDLYSFAHWEIKGVGVYQHQFLPTSPESSNDWWPIEFENETSSVTTSNPAQFEGRYYIEQLAKNNMESSPLGDSVTPVNIRSDFEIAWNGLAVINGLNKDLRELLAEKLLPVSVEYGAGFSKYWYDVVNTPPYLKQVTIQQKPNNASGLVNVYAASWADTEIDNSLSYVDATSCNDYGCASDELDKLIIKTVVSRKKILGSIANIKSIDANQLLIIELEFNEPIKQITMLRIGGFNVGGGCVLPTNGCVDITPAAPVNGVPPSNVIFDDIEGDKIWRITVPKSSLSGLNGKLVLTVKALDKNNHKNGDSASSGFSLGGELDGKPETPARRNTKIAMDSILDANPVNYYPWYKEGGTNETLNDVAYSYDFEEGDQNHVLLFDTKGSAVTINVDLTL